MVVRHLHISWAHHQFPTLLQGGSGTHKDRGITAKEVLHVVRARLSFLEFYCPLRAISKQATNKWIFSRTSLVCNGSALSAKHKTASEISSPLGRVTAGDGVFLPFRPFSKAEWRVMLYTEHCVGVLLTVCLWHSFWPLSKRPRADFPSAA